VTAPFIGEIRIFGFNFPPRNYAFAQGQILPIAQNTALFSILGTTYGGNGQTTFALPNFSGYVPMGNGDGPGLSSYVLGEISGAPTVTIDTTTMPNHNHGLNAAAPNPQNPSQIVGTPTNTAFLSASGPGSAYTNPPITPGTLVNMAPTAISLTGGGQPHSNQQPFLVLNFCIALQGIFPPRN
jgi:microcystin-dependent protein